MQEPLIPHHELERLVEIKVRQVLSEMLGLNEASQAPEYLPIAKAVKALGYDSPSQIYKDMDSGLLRVGKSKEVEDSPSAWSAEGSLLHQHSPGQKASGRRIPAAR